MSRSMAIEHVEHIERSIAPFELIYATPGTKTYQYRVSLARGIATSNYLPRDFPLHADNLVFTC